MPIKNCIGTYFTASDISVATYQWPVVCESIDKAFMVLIYWNIYSVLSPSIKQKKVHQIKHANSSKKWYNKTHPPCSHWMNMYFIHA